MLRESSGLQPDPATEFRPAVWRRGNSAGALASRCLRPRFESAAASAMPMVRFASLAQVSRAACSHPILKNYGKGPFSPLCLTSQLGYDHFCLIRGSC